MRNKFTTGNQYGNRNGRPRKNRALADNLRRVLMDSSADGVSSIDELCRDIVDLLLTRQTVDENGATIGISHAQWFDMLKWLGNHIDGAMPTEIDVQPIERLPADGAIPADRLERVFTAQLFLIKRYLSGDTLDEFMTEWQQLSSQVELLPNRSSEELEDSDAE